MLISRDGVLISRGGVLISRGVPIHVDTCRDACVKTTLLQCMGRSKSAFKGEFVKDTGYI